MEKINNLSSGDKLVIINDFLNDNRTHMEYTILNIDKSEHTSLVTLDDRNNRQIIFNINNDDYFAKDPTHEHSILTTINNAKIFQKIFNFGYFKGADESKRFVRQALGIHLNY